MSKRLRQYLGIVIVVGIAAAGWFGWKQYQEKKEMESVAIIGGSDGPTSVFIAGKTEENEQIEFEKISAEQAKEFMDTEEDFIILDVREEEEYAEGHIEGAMLIPYTEVVEQAEEKLPDKDQLILVYCRSGRRSEIATQLLTAIGYTNVKDFGGIIDWPYEVTKGE